MAVSAYGYQWQQRRFGGCFEKELIGFKDRELFDDAAWHRYQRNALRDILVHSFEQVPYYYAAFKKIGLHLSELTRFDTSDLGKLPALRKK